MTKDQLKAHCIIESDDTQDDEPVSIATPNDDTVMLYKDELVIELDLTNNLCITVQGKEHIGEHSMKPAHWQKVRVFKELVA